MFYTVDGLKYRTCTYSIIYVLVYFYFLLIETLMSKIRTIMNMCFNHTYLILSKDIGAWSKQINKWPVASQNNHLGAFIANRGVGGWVYA